MAEKKRNNAMGLIKNIYMLSVSYTFLKIFLFFSLIKDLAFHTFMKSFLSVVVSDIDVVLRLHGCE